MGVTINIEFVQFSPDVLILRLSMPEKQALDGFQYPRTHEAELDIRSSRSTVLR